MKFKLFIIGVVLGLGILGGVWRWESRKVHFHAGFALFINGERVDFAQTKYMKLDRCGDGGEREDEQLEKAHLHDNVGEVVHVHRKGAKWGDLFSNINYQFPEGEIVGYVNGQRINNILKYQIKPYDNLVITLGKSNQVNVSGVVSIERIKEVEKMSEVCGNN